MSARCKWIALIAITWIWASSVPSVDAQPAAKSGNAGKMVRVTYAVADLVTPIEDHTAFPERKPRNEKPTPSKAALSAALVDRITGTIAKETWEGVGGPASIQYFPGDLAIIVNQRESVQREIANLLVALRHEVQVSHELRLVVVPPKFADRILKMMGDHGQPVRAGNGKDGGPSEPIKRMASVDDKCIFALLEMVQRHRASQIMQTPKVTLFNGQLAGISAVTNDVAGIREGIRCDFLPIVDAERKNVRLTLEFEGVFTGGEADGVTSRHIMSAAGTFVVPTGRTMIWHLGELGARQQLFVLVTPRVIVEKQEPVFLGQAPMPHGAGAAEEQSAPELRRVGPPRAANARAIEHRLGQPISLHFKDMPLKEAIKDLSIVSGIQIVLDLPTLRDARVNLDAPVSISVENIDLKFALNILLKPISLSYVIEDQVFKITTRGREARPFYKTHKVGDLVAPLPTVEGQEAAKTLEGPLMTLIVDAVAKDSWEAAGGRGTLKYRAAEKSLTICQSQEVHEEIELLLATLRKLQDLMVNVDVRFVHASADTAKHWRKATAQDGKSVESLRFKDRNKPGQFINRTGLYLTPDPPLPTNGPRAFVRLDEKPIRAMLKILESDRRSSIIQAPKLNVYNGQSFPFECSHKKVALTEFRTPNQELSIGETITLAVARGKSEQGKTEKTAIVLAHSERTVSSWRCNVQPVVSADRRFVRLSVNVEHFGADDTKSVERITKGAKTMHLPDGQTLVWDLGETGRQHLFVLVTPRVIVREQPEPEVTEIQLPIPGR